MMKQFLTTLAILLAALCARANALDDIVPLPMHVEQLKGSLRVKGIAIKCDPAFDARTREAVGAFAAKLGYIDFSVPSGSMSFKTELGLNIRRPFFEASIVIR